MNAITSLNGINNTRNLSHISKATNQYLKDNATSSSIKDNNNTTNLNHSSSAIINRTLISFKGIEKIPTILKNIQVKITVMN